MALPRLAPSANDFTVSITVNKKLRPYFEIWFNKQKESGETPEKFALRMLKTAALNDHIQANIQASMDEAKAVSDAANQTINDDIVMMSTEVD